MKWTLVLTLFLSFSAFARDREILKCLGQEEKAYHLSKTLGPLYDLNQRIISEMVQIPYVELTPDAFQRACGDKRISPSLTVLQLSLAEGKHIFVMDSKIDSMQKSMTQGMIDDYIETSKDIFLNFVALIQAASPTPDCLDKKIKGLKELMTEIKYLQEDVDIKDIFRGRDLTIFNRLKDYKKAFQACKPKLASRKKKLKSQSTSEPKKP